MSLWIETFLLSLLMMGFGAIPLLLKKTRRPSSAFFLLGTGALTGLCLFDLIPDVAMMGGRAGIVIMLVVWVAYWFLHERSGHPAHHDHGPRDPTFFWIAMIIHCLTSGMLLALAQGFAPTVGRGVFFALLAHKAYEALTVSTILVGEGNPRRQTLYRLALYCLSLPTGVLITVLLKTHLTEITVTIATSIAVGTLLGCLMSDFLGPSIFEIRRNPIRSIWLILGLVAADLIMRR